MVQNKKGKSLGHFEVRLHIQTRGLFLSEQFWAILKYISYANQWTSDESADGRLLGSQEIPGKRAKFTEGGKDALIVGNAGQAASVDIIQAFDSGRFQTSK